MKAPRYPATKILLATRSPTPNRAHRRVEIDVVPIHKQRFPIRHPLRKDPGLVTIIPGQHVDRVPVTREVFSVDTPPPLSLGRDELHMDDIDEETTATPAPTSAATNPVQTGGNTSPPGPDSQDSAAVHTLPSTYRRERKIRLIEEYMGWFESLGNAPLETPPPCDSAVHGDVFIHTDGKNVLQMWMRTTQRTWEPINAGHKHPYLPGYLFVVKKGRPSWVTRKTVATYTYRNIALAS